MIEGQIIRNGKVVVPLATLVMTQPTHRMMCEVVSQLWDFDLSVDRVDICRSVALWTDLRVQHPKQFTLEQLVWEGWDVPCVWARFIGTNTVHEWLGGGPVPFRLESVPSPWGMIAHAWENESRSGAILVDDLGAKQHPDAWRLDAILNERFGGVP
jgi:hypothetical protein